jgi:hypothetical protein
MRPKNIFHIGQVSALYKFHCTSFSFPNSHSAGCPTLIPSGAGTTGQLMADVPSGLQISPNPQDLKKKKENLGYGVALKRTESVATQREGSTQPTAQFQTATRI